MKNEGEVHNEEVLNFHSGGNRFKSRITTPVIVIELFRVNVGVIDLNKPQFPPLKF